MQRQYQQSIPQFDIDIGAGIESRSRQYVPDAVHDMHGRKKAARRRLSNSGNLRSRGARFLN
jgi:hypothetical protein